MFHKKESNGGRKRNPFKALGPALVVLFLIVIANPSAYAIEFVTKWGTDTTSNGHFNFPWGVAVDSSGNVYVADTYNNRIQKFDSSGNYLTQWGSLGSGNGQFDYPTGAAVDSSGNVYVADTYNNRIQKFDSSGNYLTQWGSSGSGNGQFSYPFGVAIDSTGNVYVADTDNNRIQKFDSNGTYLTQWGSNGSGNGQFYYPEGVAVDSTGNVYVADTDNDRIQKFDSNGTYLTQWGSNGSGNGQFYYPSGVAVDSSGNVYVADSINYRIQKFGPFGTLTVTKAGAGQGTVTSSPSGIDCGSTCVYEFNDGTAVTLTAAPAAGSTFAGWSGACTGTDPCTLTMFSPQDVSATFLEACTYSIYPISANHSNAGNTGSKVLVIANPGCGWTATSNDSWINITAGNAGSGTAYVTYSVEANSGSDRIGTMTIAGQTFTVYQSAVFQPIPAPVLISPPDGATNVPTNITLTWNRSVGADGYEVWVVTDPAFNSHVIQAGTYDTFFNVPPNALNPFTLYYWGVQAHNGTYATHSDWSSVWSFTTTGPPPGQVSLISPPDGAPNVSTTPTLTWNAATGADSYNLQAATDSGFSNKVINESGIMSTSYIVSVPLANYTLYYWRAAGVNPVGMGSWSPTWSFTTESCSNSLNPTNASVPAPGSTDSTVSVTAGAGCSWTATSNDAWILITGGDSGSGNGTVTYNVLANTGPDRQGSMDIAGQTFTVNQASGEMIDRTVWADLEFVRRINNGVFESALTRYGSNGSNYLVFYDSSVVNSYQADVTVKNYQNNSSYPYASLLGYVYNDGTQGDGATGDVLGQVGILHNGTQLQGFYSITRCTAPNCNLPNEFQTICSGGFGPAALDTTYPISFSWDGSSFTFGFGESSRVINSSNCPSLPSNAGPPKVATKGIGTRISNINGPDEGGYIAATFDNVYVNGDPNTYDDFQSGMIDPAKWRTWESVRAASGGELLSALTERGVNGSNNMSFVNSQAILGFEADLKVTEFQYDPALPVRPMGRLYANLYNDGTGSSTPGDLKGDAGVSVGILDNGQGLGPQAFYSVSHCLAPNCNLPNEYEILYSGIFKNVGLNETHRFSLSWDGLNVTLACDGSPISYNPTSSVPVAGPPKGRKGIGTRVTQIDDSSKWAYVAASFDNVVVTDMDSNLDGLPDWWEMANFGTLAVDPNGDPDHDGFTNLQEFQMGTNPNIPDYTLAVAKAGTGIGTITSSPAGINCGSGCSKIYQINTTVVLTVVPDPSSTFTGWSGCDSTIGNQCTVTMNAPKTVTATLGTAGAPQINVKQGGTDISGGSYDFGSVVLGANSSVTFTIENPGTANLNLTGSPAMVQISGTNVGDFGMTTQPSSPIAAGGSTTFVITFTPGGLGSRSASVSISNDSGVSPYAFTITGTGIASAGNYYVDILSGDNLNDGSQSYPWKTLHYAINQINAGGVGAYFLYVVPGGTYDATSEGDSSTITITQSNLRITPGSEGRPVIQGGGSWVTAFEIASGANNVTIDNLDISGFGGSAYAIIINGSYSVIQNCHIHDNHDTGIQISSDATNTTITQNEIFNNTASGIEVSGIENYDSTAKINRNRIYGNGFAGVVTYNGGTIQNNLIYSNQVKGIYAQGGTINIFHNTIDGGGIGNWGIYFNLALCDGCPTDITGEVKYNIISNFNTGIEVDSVGNNGMVTVNYNDLCNPDPNSPNPEFPCGPSSGNYAGTAVAGAHDISVNPLYKDPVNGDFTLQTTPTGSPCIDAISIGDPPGDPVTDDYNGSPRPQGLGFDMGAYEAFPPEMVIATNGIYKLFVKSLWESYGTFTIMTGDLHPFPDENVLFGNGNPGTTYLTVRSYTSNKDYVSTSGMPSSSFAVVNLDNFSPVITPIGSTGYKTTWPVTAPDPLTIEQVTNIEGTTLDDSVVRITTTVKNNGTSPVQIGIRYEWDWMIDGSDNALIKRHKPDDPDFTSAFFEETPPGFSYYEETNTPATFSIFGTVNGPSTLSPPPTPPHRFNYSGWGSAVSNAWDFAVTGGGTDSAVCYYWGDTPSNAITINPGGSYSVTQYITTSQESLRPGIIVTPTNLNFGDVLVGTTSDQTVMVENSGTGILILGTIGSPSAPFSRAGGTCTDSQTLNPGEDCSIIMRFAPTSTGLFNSGFSIPSNDPDEPVANVSVSGTGALPPVPHITVTDSVAPPDDHQVPFGQVTVGNSLDGTVTIRNDGNADLVIGNVAQVDPLATPFSIVLPDNCSGQTLITGASCGLTVRFSPTAAGPFSDSFDIPSNDPVNSSVTVSVSGTGALRPVPHITVTDSIEPINDHQVPFGQVTVGNSLDSTVTIRNDGNADLVIGNVAQVDPLATPFSIVLPDNCSGQTLIPGASCVLTVRFSPVAAGPFSDSFDFPSNDPVTSSLTVSVTGTGALRPVPHITVTDSVEPINDHQVPFGQVTVGNSLDITVTIRNDGNADLVIGNVAQVDPLATPFSIVLPDNCSGQTLIPGASCVLTVRFSPIAANPFSDSFDIPSNDPVNSSVTVSVSGTGALPPVPHITVTDSVAPPDDHQVPFGQVTVGNSLDGTVTIRNDGNADLVIGNVAQVDPLATPFSIVLPDNCSGQTLIPGASCVLTVRFSPTAVGPFSDSFDIPSNDPVNSSVTVSVSGTGALPPVPHITVTDSVSPIDDHQVPFGQVTVANSLDSTVTIRNDGNAGLVIGNVGQVDPLATPFSIVLPDNCSTQTLIPGASCVLTVRFSPTAAGPFSDSFDIPSNDPVTSSVTVSVSGTGALPPVPHITVTDSIEPINDHQVPFGQVTVGNSLDSTVTIGNNGNADLVIGNVGQVNPLATPFSIVLPDNCSTQTLIPGASCVLTVRFSPIAANAFSDSFDIPSNDPVNGSVTVGVSGTGSLPPAPHITVTDSVAPIDDHQVPFGQVTVGNSLDSTVTIRNDGNADLVIGNVARVDPLAAPFSIVLPDNCSGQTLIPGASCVLTVRFSPTDAGVFSDSFDIPSNDPVSSSVTVSVSGTGTLLPVPHITVTDSVEPINDHQVPFGQVTVGNSLDSTVTIGNNGNADLVIGSVAQVDPLATPFSIVLPDNCSGQTLIPGASCVLTVRFSPTDAGVFSDSFDIPSNDPVNSSVTVSVSGTGGFIVTVGKSGAGTGIITGSPPGLYAFGTRVTLSIEPDANCRVSDVTIDGVSIGPVNTVTIREMMSNHTVNVTFEYE